MNYIYLEYSEKFLLDKSEYDIFISGPITMSDYNNFLEYSNILDMAPASYASGIFIYKDSEPVKKTLINNVLILHPETLTSSSKRSLVGVNNLIIDGEIKNGAPMTGYATVNWRLAKELDLKIGDKIFYENSDDKFNFIVSGISITVPQVEIVVEFTPELTDYISRANGNEYAGALYIKTKDVDETLDFLESYVFEKKKDWIILTKDTLYEQVEEDFNHPFYKKSYIAFVVVGFLTYLIVLAGEQINLITSKKTKKTVSRWTYYTWQVTVFSFIIAFSVIITRLIYNNFLWIYLPLQAFIKPLSLLLGLSVIVTLTIYEIWWRLEA